LAGFSMKAMRCLLRALARLLRGQPWSIPRWRIAISGREQGIGCKSKRPMQPPAHAAAAEARGNATLPQAACLRT
jgi:hypothetical protein